MLAIEKHGEEAFTVHKKILAQKYEMGVAFLELGMLLKQVRDKHYYQVLGYDSFQSYIINSELGFKRRTAYYYIEIYEWYVEKLSYSVILLADIGHDKLLRALPIIKEEYPKLSSSKMKKRVEQIITEVEELRPVDFDKKYKDEKKQEEHKDFLAPPEYFRCEKCSKWRIVIPLEDCCLEWLSEVKSYLNKKK